MIKHARVILKSLTKLVISEDEVIWIDFDNQTFHQVTEKSIPSRSCAFPKNEPALKSLLRKLSEEGYICLGNNFDYCSVTEKGLHYNAYRMENIRSFFVRSILTPVLVSFFTTLLTLLLNTLL